MKKILCVLTVCMIAMTAAAVPARRGPITRTAEDGTKKTVFLHGDAFFHYMTDAEGNWLDEKTLQPMSAGQREAKEQSGQARLQARRVQQASGVKRLLAPKGAIILASFADKKFSSTLEGMTAWAMGDNYTYNGATGSIRKYFLDQSWGAYDMQSDVYGPVTLSKQLAYYGENDSNGDDKHADDMIVEACKLAHENCGADFSKYDSNNDNKVDWVVVIYAGYGEADGGPANTVWPHQYDLSNTGKSFKLDGKTVDHYCCLNEKDYYTKKRAGIGTFCHEFSHVMGLPDLYSTNNASHKTMGQWDLLDYGPYNNDGNTPPSYSAYERWFMGWMTPRLLTDPEYVWLNPLNDSHEALLMCNGDTHNLDGLNPDPTTFYLLESRKKEGWDKYLPGEGLLITQIKFSSSKWSNNTVNNTASSMGVDIIEADGKVPSYVESKPDNGYFGKAKDAFPAGADAYTGLANHEITVIALQEGGAVTFSYRGGTEGQAVELVDDGVTATKILRDGQVLIIRGDKVYDLNGRQLER